MRLSPERVFNEFMLSLKLLNLLCLALAATTNSSCFCAVCLSFFNSSLRQLHDDARVCIYTSAAVIILRKLAVIATTTNFAKSPSLQTSYNSYSNKQARPLKRFPQALLAHEAKFKHALLLYLHIALSLPLAHKASNSRNLSVIRRVSFSRLCVS